MVSPENRPLLERLFGTRPYARRCGKRRESELDRMRAQVGQEAIGDRIHAKVSSSKQSVLDHIRADAAVAGHIRCEKLESLK